ncbi:MAG: DNA repair protein RadA, partial [Ostreibacterium sp.]
MAKPTIEYHCRECGVIYKKWMGQCGDCKAWNSLDEVVAHNSKENKPSRGGGYAGATSRDIVTLDVVGTQEKVTYSTGLLELDRVLGKGVIKGSVVLIGGDPGIGKSTLLLQAMANLSTTMNTLYISGEESAEQISLRGLRLGQDVSQLAFLSETEIEVILATLQTFKPDVLVIDSIQTIFTSTLSSAPGSLSQIRESAAALVRYAKQTGCTIFVVGHVTKEGAIAGPRVLEHMVDTVLYFEGETASKFRLLRVVKNRFGPVNELGIFAMTETGLKGVSNPSAIFLSRHEEAVSGSVILVSWEGSRAILVELQSLVDDAHNNPKRITIGLEQSRLTMLLAVLS